MHACTFLFDQLPDMVNHDAGNFLHDGDNYTVSELAVSLGIADRNPECVRKPHQPGTFTWSQSSWPLIISLPD